MIRALIVSLLIPLGGAWAAAQSTGAPTALAFCKEDIGRWCSDKNPVPCLLQNTAKLSPNCQQELTKLAEARRQAAQRGGGALSSFGGLNAMGPPIPLFSYEFQALPKSPGGLNETENKINISSPVYQSESDTLALSLAASQLHMSNSVTLDTQQVVPTDWTRAELGLQYSHQLPEKKRWGLRGSYGYSGDKPSQIAQDASYSVGGTYGFPGGAGYWTVMAFMANNNSIAPYIPLPGLMYLYRTPTFTGLFGFPFNSIQWVPINPWVFSLSLFGANAQLETAYGLFGHGQAFLTYGYLEQSYIPSFRTDEKQRLTFHQQKLGAGIRLPSYGGGQLELQAGRSFDRRIYMGTRYLNRDDGVAAFEPDWYANLALKIAF